MIFFVTTSDLLIAIDFPRQLIEHVAAVFEREGLRTAWEWHLIFRLKSLSQRPWWRTSLFGWISI
jgi:hypothetical protein